MPLTPVDAVLALDLGSGAVAGRTNGFEAATSRCICRVGGLVDLDDGWAVALSLLASLWLLNVSVLAQALLVIGLSSWPRVSSSLQGATGFLSCRAAVAAFVLSLSTFSLFWFPSFKLLILLLCRWVSRCLGTPLLKGWCSETSSAARTMVSRTVLVFSDGVKHAETCSASTRCIAISSTDVLLDARSLQRSEIVAYTYI